VAGIRAENQPIRGLVGGIKLLGLGESPVFSQTLRDELKAKTVERDAIRKTNCSAFCPVWAAVADGMLPFLLAVAGEG
jgi:hypothetical protein